MQLLWINLVTDSLPAIALGMEKAESDSMQKPPRDSKDGIFAGGMGFDIGFQGLIISVLTLASYFIGHYMESGVWEIANSLDGMTMAFLTLSMVEIFHSFNMRSRRGSIFKMNNSNKFLWLSFVISLICTVGVINVPFLRVAFKFEHISFAEYMVAMVLAISIIPIMEITKAVQRKRNK